MRWGWLCLSLLYNPCRNIPVLAVDWNEIGGKAYYRSGADRCFQMRRAGFIRFFFDWFQNGKVFCRIRRCGALFDFDWINRAVLIYYQVDFLLIAIAVEIQRRALSDVQIAFPYLGYNPCLKERSVHSAVFQYHCTAPAHQVGAQSSIQKIHPRRFDYAFQRVVGIWLYQSDDTAGNKNRQPLLRCWRRDACLLCQRFIIDIGRRASRYYTNKIQIGRLIRNLLQITDVAAEISIEIRLKIQFSIDIFDLIQARHGAIEDALKNIRHEADALKVRLLNAISAEEDRLAAQQAAQNDDSDVPAVTLPKKKHKTISIKALTSQTTWRIESDEDIAISFVVFLIMCIIR